MKLRTKIGLHLHKMHYKAQVTLHELSYLFWECTLRCNLNCRHCGSDCISQSDVPDMPAEDFLKEIRKISDHVNPNKTMIVITGGETLLRQDLEEVGEALYQMGFPWGFVTNGELLTEKRLVSLLNSGLRSMTISLDGLAKSHQWMRGTRSSFERVCNSIALCTAVPDLVFDVVTCVTQKNFNELEELKRVLISLGVTRWRLFPVFPKGRAVEDKDLQLSNQQYRELLEFIKECRKEGLVMASHSCEGYLGEYEGQVRDNFFSCKAGITIGSILVDGSISACPSLRGDYIQGNIYKHEFMDVWENRFDIMRDRSWTKSGECADCKEFNFCQGNGLHLRDEKSGELAKCHLAMLS